LRRWYLSFRDNVLTLNKMYLVQVCIAYTLVSSALLFTVNGFAVHAS
jgi:hypothetical protein